MNSRALLKNPSGRNSLSGAILCKEGLESFMMPKKGWIIASWAGAAMSSPPLFGTLHPGWNNVGSANTRRTPAEG